MKNNKVLDLKKPAEISADPLTELLRKRARKLIAEAVEVELQELLEKYSGLRDEHGDRLIVRNGNLPERELQTGIGPVKVKAPKVRDKSGNGIKFNSALVPPYLRKTKNAEEVLPWLYLKDR